MLVPFELKLLLPVPEKYFFCLLSYFLQILPINIINYYKSYLYLTEHISSVISRINYFFYTFIQKQTFLFTSINQIVFRPTQLIYLQDIFTKTKFLVFWVLIFSQLFLSAFLLKYFSYWKHLILDIHLSVFYVKKIPRNLH